MNFWDNLFLLFAFLGALCAYFAIGGALIERFCKRKVTSIWGRDLK